MIGLPVLARRSFLVRAGAARPHRARRCLPFLGFVLASLPLAPARADYPTRIGTRALGMGGAIRATATGDAGPMLNPAGISLIRSYIVEGSYQFDDLPAPAMANAGSMHRAHVSVVDSSSAARIGGALYYTYLTGRPAPGLAQEGHQAGIALSFPFGTHLALGATGKYLDLRTMPTGSPRDRDRGVTFDLGAILKPITGLGIALVGYNLIKRDTLLAPRALGYGVAYAPVPTIVIALDATADFDSNGLLGRTERTLHSAMGGMEFEVLPGQLVMRGGGGRDGIRGSGYVSAGLSGMSETGAVDLAIQRDVSGGTKQTIFSASVRLFVPSP